MSVRPSVCQCVFLSSWPERQTASVFGSDDDYSSTCCSSTYLHLLHLFPIVVVADRKKEQHLRFLVATRAGQTSSKCCCFGFVVILDSCLSPLFLFISNVIVSFCFIGIGGYMCAFFIVLGPFLHARWSEFHHVALIKLRSGTTQTSLYLEGSRNSSLYNTLGRRHMCNREPVSFKPHRLCYLIE